MATSQSEEPDASIHSIGVDEEWIQVFLLMNFFKENGCAKKYTKSLLKFSVSFSARACTGISQHCEISKLVSSSSAA